jgi:hypothetical protein
MEGCFLFEEDATKETTWMHLDLSVDNSLYKGYANDIDPDYKAEFKAFSYVWGSTDDKETLFIVNANDGRETFIVLDHSNYTNSSRGSSTLEICEFSKSSLGRCHLH